MAKDASKKAALSKAKMAANKSTINAVANNAAKGKKKGKKKTAPNPKTVAEAYSVYNKKHAKPKTSRAKLVKSEEAKQAAKGKKAKQAKQGKAKHSSKKAKGAKMSRRVKTVAIIAAAVVLVFALSCVAFAMDEQARSQFVPEETTLDGQIDISGLTEDELRALLENRVANGAGTTIVVSSEDAGQDIAMSEVGIINIDATIDQAFSPYHANPVMRAFDRLNELCTGDVPTYNVALVCDVDQEALLARVEQASEDLDRPAKNAGYAYDRGSNALVVTDAKQGIEMDVAATAARIEAALLDVTSDDPNRLNIEADAVVTEAESHEPGQGIFVDTRNCRVYLYEGGQVTVSYPCTPGTSGYATPTGDFFLSYKDAAPTWYNPHSAWAEGMPETIGPGPSNPLGVRALAVSCGNGIFLHGTTNTGGLGSPGSHGCVRLSNSNITDLYDRVSEGIPIIIR